jgi:aspartyl-tRNA(Asn)/glutamyl-tRNA(Gln) amidotransferase subunit A
VPDYAGLLAEGREPRGARIGVVETWFDPGLDRGIATCLEKVLAELEGRGASIVPVTLPASRHAIPVYYLVATAEASSNLARYDGVRYGHRAAGSDDLVEMYVRSRSEGFGREVKRRIMLGTYALSAGYHDAYYLKAQQVRTLVRQDFDAALAEVDVVVAPTTPTTAFRLGEKVADPLQMYLSDVYTTPASLAGLPAISVPAGLTGDPPLPVGLQVIGRPFDEAGVLQVARWVEQIAGEAPPAPLRGEAPPAEPAP